MKASLTAKSIKNLDRSKMLDLLLDFPLQCRAAIDIAERAEIGSVKNNYDKIVFCGLGGSAIGADFVRSYLYSKGRFPISVVREYDLPAYVDAQTLVFVCSYSGNTEETLSAYEQARQRGSSMIAVSSGGKIEEWALRDKVAFIPIPKNQPPRTALGYLSLIPLSLLARLGLIAEVRDEVSQAIRLLESMRDKNLKPGIGQKDNLAKYLAAKLYNKLPFIYASSVHFDVVACRLRGQLNENSKALASSHLFPEMNHNEIVGWQNPKKLLKDFIVLMLKDKGMHPRVEKRMDITGAILKKEKVEVIEVESRGEGLLSRMFSLIYTGDFISYYLALLYGIDPTPVDRVTYLKNKLAES
ncbi:MAG: bifunctional phosphoglucose/phosphomannose isomerase [Candidatus Omnitrophica bacterium]|nr:bifunctional phosphoglucose/phosphomannose isomerase [Candidatus Omnitrophota bacterium]